MQISIFINGNSILTSVSKNTNKHHCDGCSATLPLGKVFCSMKLHVFSVRWSHLMTQVSYLSLNHLLTFSGPCWSPRPHWSPRCPRLPGQCADKSHFTHIMFWSAAVFCIVLTIVWWQQMRGSNVFPLARIGLTLSLTHYNRKNVRVDKLPAGTDV